MTDDKDAELRDLRRRVAELETSKAAGAPPAVAAKPKTKTSDALAR